MKHTQSSGLLFVSACCVLATACADPAAQPELSVTVTGLSMTTTNRDVTPGDISVELNFVPSGAMGGARPHRRIVLFEGGDAQTLRVQVPEGTYTVNARVSTLLNCTPAPREIQLGASASGVALTVSSSGVDAATTPSIAVSPTSIPSPPCG